MKKLLCFLTALSFISCALDYEDNRRIHLTGSLLDPAGDPLRDAGVDLYVETFGFKNSVSNVIASTTTTENGHFDLLSIEPKDEILFLSISERLSSFMGVRIRESVDNHGPFYDLGELRLNARGNFQLNFINQSGTEEMVFLQVKYPAYTAFQSLPEGWEYVYTYEGSETGEVTDLRTFSTQGNNQIYLTTLLNSQVQIKYSIGESLNQSDDIQELVLDISESESQYEIIF
ncbi:carboxypeptidase-like regulatory domain-containing protein [Gramella sp. GC03-9]|uniref:Carboxypeptidase-like regulatory domain-containing protein n=1 Tax=Christiangramia oceanisediminis TaxID=2920386 RepID=A0A9X2I7T7_9FLAO|nr:carboxypeptidase-like regulatory domain-containing protein [Gramella oceanisediminis]MCP9199344.1 carboxypeptidase-like regulatory domain-containing protein [Gramella oceanisediminis]